MLQEVTGIPRSTHEVHEAYTAADIRRFINSGMRYAELSYEGKSAEAVHKSAGEYIKRHGMSSKVAVTTRKRNGKAKAYLVSLDPNR